MENKEHHDQNGASRRRGVIWKLESIEYGLWRFFEQHGRYPTTREVDHDPNLPSSRQIQRQYGGLKKLRERLGWSEQTDFTKGDHSSQRAYSINQRAHQTEKEVYDFLIKKFGVQFVHREYMFTDDGRSRTDFFIFDKQGNFSVDVFYPKDKFNLIGCLNSKIQKYDSDIMIQYPVIFLQLNKDISEEEMEKIVANKKRKLDRNQFLMGWQKFKDFCDKRTRLTVK